MSAVVRLVAAFAILLGTLWPAFGRTVSAQGTPEAQGYGRESDGYVGEFAEVLTQLDAFWQMNFERAGATYRKPTVIAVEAYLDTACGTVSPERIAAYCRLDETIYYSPGIFDEKSQRIGDFVPIVVTAHEWGHHVQRLIGLTPEPGNAFELQADCLAGAYTSEAGQRGLLDPGDVTEAVQASAEAGDPLGLPQDAPGAHGINDDRVSAFMRGYLDGATGCGLPLAAAPASGPDVTNPQPAPETEGRSRSLANLVPSQLDLPEGQSFRVADQGATTFDILASGFPDPGEAAARLREWRWQANSYRYFASDNPPPNAAGWVELSIHGFAGADGAAAALPYFASSRARALGLAPIEIALFGDQSAAITGPASNGTEMTIYARRGNLLIRATAISPQGTPRADVTEVALVPLRHLINDLGIVSPALRGLLPPTPMMPAGLVPAGDQAKSAGAIADTFADPDEAGRLFQAWGWREHAARSFVAEGPGTANGTTQFDVAAYRFADPAGASQALPFFVDTRAEALGLREVAAPVAGDEARAISGPVQGGHEATVYVRADTVLLRFTAVGSGTPMADIEALLSHLRKGTDSRSDDTTAFEGGPTGFHWSVGAADGTG
jgi:predicted metalloprotease